MSTIFEISVSQKFAYETFLYFQVRVAIITYTLSYRILWGKCGGEKHSNIFPVVAIDFLWDSTGEV